MTRDKMAIFATRGSSCPEASESRLRTTAHNELFGEGKERERGVVNRGVEGVSPGLDVTSALMRRLSRKPLS